MKKLPAVAYVMPSVLRSAAYAAPMCHQRYTGIIENHEYYATHGHLREPESQLPANFLMKAKPFFKP